MRWRTAYTCGTVTNIEGVTRSFIPAIHSIKSEVTTDDQTTFISSYLDNLFAVLYEACENENYLTLNQDGLITESTFTSSFEVADSLLDLESVVNMYILYEIAHDYDVGRGSFYMCIDFSPKSQCESLQFTSPRDFNWTYANEAAGQYYAGLSAAKALRKIRRLQQSLVYPFDEGRLVCRS